MNANSSEIREVSTRLGTKLEVTILSPFNPRVDLISHIDGRKVKSLKISSAYFSYSANCHIKRVWVEFED